MASCAACLQPLYTSQRFVLDGTEVFHAACAGQAYRSKLRISEQRVRELESQLADTRRAAARVEAETSRLRNEVTSRTAEVITLTGLVAGHRSQLVLAQERLQGREDELRASRNESAAMRVELATVKRDAVPADAAHESDADASVQRFRMLELD
jgi:chromosome segregation ATPase